MKGTEKQIKYATDLINDRIKWNKTEATQYDAMDIETESGIMVSFLDVERYLESLLQNEDTDAGKAIAYFKKTKYDALANEVAEIIVANEIELATKEELFAWGSEIIREQGKGFPKEEAEAEVEALRKELGLVEEAQVEVVEVVEVETLTFPTIQNFLENTETIEECGNGDLVVYTQGRMFLTTDKEFCKKYSANKMFSDGDKAVAKHFVKLNIADKSYEFVELEIEYTTTKEPFSDDFIDWENWTEYYQKGFNNAAVCFTYIPDMEKSDDIVSYYKGYSDGKRFKKALKMYLEEGAEL